MTDNDPISDATPSSKRRKLNTQGNSDRVWDSDNDSGDEFFADHETIATIPLEPRLDKTQQMPGFLDKRVRNDLQSSSLLDRSTPYITQPTQPLNRTTQPTQPIDPDSLPQDVQVECSSPTPAPASADTASQRMPPPITRAPFARPTGFLAGAMAPRGTAYRRPQGTQDKREIVNVDSDEDDPPVEHSSDEDSRGMASNLKPTKFVKGGRGLDSSPNEVINESPRPGPPPPPTQFSRMLDSFKHSDEPAYDMASAYASGSRPPRPQQARPTAASSRPRPMTGSPYQTLDDIQDWKARQKVERIQGVLGEDVSVARCYDALKRKHFNYDDAMNWLVEMADAEATADTVDELAPTPMKAALAAKGLAVPVSLPASQSNKPSARQDVRAPSRTIAEKYGAQAARKSGQTQSQVQPVGESQEDVVKPRKRLQQGRRPRTPSPPSSPPQTQAPAARKLSKRPVITIDDDSDEDHSAVVEARRPPIETSHDQRLLKFFNECSAQDLVDLSAQPDADVRLVIDHRPYKRLDQVRAVSKTAAKAGRKSNARPVGDKIVDICSDVWAGYDAVDDLVNECEKLAKPIQAALKGWGVGETGGGSGGDTGELQLMKLDEAHDSGIGTPASSCTADDAPTTPASSKSKARPRFLTQPENMSPDVLLKDYQLVGLNWLNLLWSKKMSCILADDMGLGKTCQVIAFLSHLQSREVDGVHLVIVPGSTLENWLREFQRFAPELTIFPYYGSQAERPGLQEQIEDEWDSIEVVVTTYDMAVKDNRFLRRLGFSVCVYDEAHQLRNPKSDRYISLMRIPAEFKVLLTGTPLQNNLQELIAILAFIMPALFSEKREALEYIFQHKASTKEADHAALLSAQRIQRARSMITPFILRRKKAQVLDLPTKHSRVEYCELTATQAAHYAEVEEEARRLFTEKASGRKGTTKASLNVLMALRKAAIHPLLSRRIYDDKKIDKIVGLLVKHEEFASNPPEKIRKYLLGEAAQSLAGSDFSLHKFCAERDYLARLALRRDEWMDSGKVRKLAELVKGYAAAGDRALVFSQFTMTLDVLEAVLETLGIKYMRLDGSTRMDLRQDMLDKFAAEPDITVFMLSTRAGGAGINLAAANRVVIFDSGFNPQDDVQAENRAHRVGQTREVEVVRLVTRGTIEEQIHALGESKLALDERVAGEGAGAVEDRAAERAGAEAVERMFMRRVKEEEEEEEGKGKGEGKGEEQERDLKDVFRKGLEDAGLQVD